MQPIKNVLKRPTSSPTRNMLNAFFLPEDQDGFARQQGYADAEQMIHYEDTQRAEEVPPMTDREVEQLQEREETVADESGTVEYLAPPPSEILVLMRQDSREAYNEDEACPLRAWYDTSDELAGVY